MFREGKGGRKEEKHQCVVASHPPPTWDLSCNPGMCPDWESNQRPFDSQASTQSTEPHQPGLILHISNFILKTQPSFLCSLRYFPLPFFPPGCVVCVCMCTGVFLNRSIFLPLPSSLAIIYLPIYIHLCAHFT